MSDTAVSAAPFVAFVEPYLASIAAAVVPVLIGIAVNAFTKWTGVKVDSTYTSMVEAAAATEAGKLVAAASDNLATAQVDVKSPAVRDAAILIASKLPDAVAALGLKPADIAAVVAGEVGKLQAKMTSVTPALAFSK